MVTKTGMAEIYAARKRNLARLLEQPGARSALAIKLDVTKARITHLLTPSGPGSRPIKEDTARQIEEVMGLPDRYLDTDHPAPKA